MSLWFTPRKILLVNIPFYHHFVGSQDTWPLPGFCWVTQKVIASACACTSLCLSGPGLLQRTVSNCVLVPWWSAPWVRDHHFSACLLLQHKRKGIGSLSALAAPTISAWFLLALLNAIIDQITFKVIGEHEGFRGSEFLNEISCPCMSPYALRKVTLSHMYVFSYSHWKLEVQISHYFLRELFHYKETSGFTEALNSGLHMHRERKFYTAVMFFPPSPLRKGG